VSGERESSLADPHGGPAATGWVGELSEEGEVSSGMPQGTVLRPCLFSIFIHDGDDCTVGPTNIFKFANVTKFWNAVENEIDRFGLLETLDKLCIRADLGVYRRSG
jgi:hypothetical protein